MSEILKSTVTRRCPFCDGSFSDARDPVSDEPTGLIHTIPMCEQFQQMSVLDFVRAANLIYASAAFDPLSKKERGQA